MRKSILFFLLSCLFAWCLAAIYFGLGIELHSIWFMALGPLYMFTPTAAALVVQKLVYRGSLETLAVRFRFNRWIVLAWLAPPVVVLASLAASTALPGIALSLDAESISAQVVAALPPEQAELGLQQLQALGPALPAIIFFGTLISALIAGPTINAAVALGEEIGWRGLLLHELLPLGFWVSSLITGVAWGIWHLPLILKGHNYPDHPVAGVFMMVAFTVLLSPLFAFLRLRAGSVLAPAIAHGVLNATGGLVLLLHGASDLTRGITGVAGLALLAVLNLILWAHLRRAL